VASRALRIRIDNQRDVVAQQDQQNNPYAPQHVGALRIPVPERATLNGAGKAAVSSAGSPDEPL
jgi:hypothetical protein